MRIYNTKLNTYNLIKTLLYLMEVKRCNSQDDQQERRDSKISGGGLVDGVDDDEGPLPGFRFHPTDEELVSFYLKRKVEKRRPLSIEIIKQIDIYKYDPWDLASTYIYALLYFPY